MDLNRKAIPRKEIIKLHKEKLFLERKLNSSEISRARLENTKDRLQVLMKQIHAELADKNATLERLYQELSQEKEKSEALLLNILPKEVADELKQHGFVDPVHFEQVSVFFTDFKGFTQVAETMTPTELITELDRCFSVMDEIMSRHRMEKLKTIGDSYMAAGGIPISNTTNAIDAVLAGLEIIDFIEKLKTEKQSKGLPFFELRIGIHTGSLVAGVIGNKKFAYDIWGDTVNLASRMESSGFPGKINVSEETHTLIQNYFVTESRGKIPAKNKGEVEMFFVHRIKEEFSIDKNGILPNSKLQEILAGLLNSQSPSPTKEF